MGRLKDGGDNGGSSHGPWEIGETRMFRARDGEKTFHVTRTHRPYVFDLRDAYNAALTDEQRRAGAEWRVDRRGELHLGYFTDPEPQPKAAWKPDDLLSS